MDKVKQKKAVYTQVMRCKFFPLENRGVCENMKKMWYGQTDHRCQHNTAHALCMLKYFHGNNGYVNAPQCYISSYITSLLIFMKYRNNVVNISREGPVAPNIEMKCEEGLRHGCTRVWRSATWRPCSQTAVPKCVVTTVPKASSNRTMMTESR